MILHGIYNNGNITINEKDIPMVISEVEIILKDKPWQKKIQKIKIKGDPLSETVISSRYEEKSLVNF